jgi:hypothetical protein
VTKDINQVVLECAMKVSKEFNEQWSNYQLEESSYTSSLVEAAKQIIQFEFEHSVVKAQIQNNVQSVIEALTVWIMENEVEPNDN